MSAFATLFSKTVFAVSKHQPVYLHSHWSLIDDASIMRHCAACVIHLI